MIGWRDIHRRGDIHRLRGVVRSVTRLAPASKARAVSAVCLIGRLLKPGACSAELLKQAPPGIEPAGAWQALPG